MFSLSLKKRCPLEELNSIDPVSKFNSPERHFRKVVFPEPLFPTIAQISPNFKEKFTLFNIGVLEKDLERFFICNIISFA